MNRSSFFRRSIFTLTATLLSLSCDRRTPDASTPNIDAPIALAETRFLGNDGVEVEGATLSILLLGSGRTAMIDPFGHAVLLFDDRQKQTASLGRAGEGPGEFAGASSIISGKGDTLEVWDSVQHRLSYLDRSVRFVKSSPLAKWPTEPFFKIVGQFADGRLVGLTKISTRLTMGRTELTTDSVGVLVGYPDSVPKTIFVLRGVTSVHAIDGASMVSLGVEATFPNAGIVCKMGMILTVENSLVVYNADKETQMRYPSFAPTFPLTSARRRDMRISAVTSVANPAVRADAESLIDHELRSRSVIVASPIIDSNGRLWYSKRGAKRLFARYSLSGTLDAMVRLPEAVFPLQADDDRFAVIVPGNDSTDHATLILRIPPTALAARRTPDAGLGRCGSAFRY